MTSMLRFRDAEEWREWAERRKARFSTRPENSQAEGSVTKIGMGGAVFVADNFEFVELQEGTLRITKPATRPPAPRDLFDQRLPPLLESAVLPSILAALRAHPKVVAVSRMNTGGMQMEGRYIPFGFTGCPDIWFLLKGGRCGWCEVKRVGNKPSAAQAAFMELVRRNGGIAFCAWSIDDVMRELA